MTDKRGKNDRNDAQAISEAANRPGMHDVAIKDGAIKDGAIKSAETQAKAMLLSVRELLVRQRISQPGSACRRGRTRPAASSAWAVSAGPGTRGCGRCWCWGPLQ